MAAQGRMTQRMIADKVGVSVTTVSRVLSRESEPERWASKETIEAIRRAAEEGGYRRNPHAVSLRSDRSGVVGVLVPRLQDFVLATIYEGIEEAAAERDVSTFVTNSLDEPALRRTRTRTMLDRLVDGLIFGDAQVEDPYLDELDAQGIPFVLVSRRSAAHVSVTCDDVLGGRLAAEHLLSIGRTDVAVLGGRRYASTGVERTKGLVDALAEAGVDVPERRIAWEGFDAQGGKAGAERILDRPPYPDALFATNDFAAIGAMGALREKGLRVPEDIVLIGYNDTPLAASNSIALTTIRSPMHEMGRLGMETLLARLAGEQVASRLLVPELVVRDSTGVRAVDA